MVSYISEYFDKMTFPQSTDKQNSCIIAIYANQREIVIGQ